MRRAYLLVTILALLLVLAPAAQAQTVAAPSVQILSPMDGATVMGPDVAVSVSVTGLVLSPGEIGMLPVPGHGHMHVLLDGMLTSVTASDTFTLMGLMPGMRTLRVGLHQNNHSALVPPVEATATFTVQ